MEYPATSATVEILPNGLTLILDPESSAPVVSAQCWVATGSIHEDHLLGSGVSHFLEHMVFKGTRDYDGPTLADVVQSAGGHWNAYTTFDRTVYYIDGPAESLETFLRCLTGLVFFPTLPESEFANEQDVIRREIDMGLDDPHQASTQLFLSTAFTLDPRRHPVIGHRHLFDKITHSDLLNYHRNRYTSDRCHLVLSGDFDPAQVRQWAIDLTRDCLPGCGREPLVSADFPQIGPRKARETFAVPTSRQTLAWKIPPLEHPDAPAWQVLATLLGQGRSARLPARLRDRQGLALEISAFAWCDAGREGVLAISAESEPTRRDELIRAILAEIATLAQSNPADLDAEREKACRQIAASQFQTLTTASGRASDLASNWHEARDLDFTRRHIAAIQQVLSADLVRLAASLREDRMTLTLLDPAESAAPARSLARSHRVAPVEEFRLPNGLSVALLPDRRVPLFRCEAAVRAGLTSETTETQGLNLLLAAVLPKGSTRRNAQEIANALESLGARCGASSGNNTLLACTAGLSTDRRMLVETLAEILLEPAFAAEPLAREKASQLASLQEARLAPLPTAFRELRRSLFQGHGLGFESLGTPETLDQLQRDTLAHHHHHHVTASNASLALAGDFDPAEIREIIESAWSAMRSGEARTPSPSRLQPGGSLLTRLPKKQAALAIGFPGFSATHPERHHLGLIREYAADMAGPLFTRIREELGLAYQVGATEFHGHDTGMFTFYLATSPEQVELAREELLAEINRIAQAGIPDDSFDQARATVLSALALQQQSTLACARSAAIDVLNGLPADHHRSLPNLIRSLTPAEVRATAHRIFSQPPTISLVLPEEDA